MSSSPKAPAWEHGMFGFWAALWERVHGPLAVTPHDEREAAWARLAVLERELAEIDREWAALHAASERPADAE